ncbi:MAG TPA: MBL fold metallo-hydrolase [Acidobacteriaceae bacterium]|nr:MBL fold metallo-hydrolase [Acidobacteriaceae bacterium]
MSEASLSMTYIGGPTVLIDVAGMRLLTDPTFDDAGGIYVRTSTLRKLTGPALSASAVGRIDAVLLSHHQHADNLDRAGEAVLKNAARVITTVEGAGALGGNAFGLAPWQSAEIEGPHGRALRITATPARHGPPERASLAVTGFVLDASGGIYISGDTVLYDGVRQVIERLHPHIAVLHLGAARVEQAGPKALTDPLTMTAEEAVAFARLTPDTRIVPIHYEGWAHFTEGRDVIERAFATAKLSDRLTWLKAGEPVAMD